MRSTKRERATGDRGAAASGAPSLAIDAALAARWLEAFLRDELVERRGIAHAVIGLSGGVDSAVVAYLAARALGLA